MPLVALLELQTQMRIWPLLNHWWEMRIRKVNYESCAILAAVSFRKELRLCLQRVYRTGPQSVTLAHHIILIPNPDKVNIQEVPTRKVKVFNPNKVNIQEAPTRKVEILLDLGIMMGTHQNGSLDRLLAVWIITPYQAVQFLGSTSLVIMYLFLYEIEAIFSY